MIYLGKYEQIGKAWGAVAKHIFTHGKEYSSSEECYLETKGISISVDVDNSEDMIIRKYSDPTDEIWMKQNFEKIGIIPELKGANSYASRLYRYAGEKNQIEWVVEKLNGKRNVRSATITTFEPLTDTNYIPCISMIDFDVVADVLDVYVYARALDFGKKAHANLICINDLLNHIAQRVSLFPGQIHLICKSAHIYNTDYKLIKSMISELDL